MITAFFEPSTRTRLSFEMAAHRLGARISVFDSSSSSLKKGESIAESIVNILALDPDFLVIRLARPLGPGLPKNGKASTIIINGGDGINEHPTQALLDCFTLLEHFKSEDLSLRTIPIIGDIAHSRVAHSTMKLLDAPWRARYLTCTISVSTNRLKP